jgi:hypothetical protein
MIKNKIGENAGKIWTILNENKKMNIAKLRKAASLNDKDLYLSLGWLSKDNKVIFWGDKAKIKFV